VVSYGDARLTYDSPLYAYGGSYPVSLSGSLVSGTGRMGSYESFFPSISGTQPIIPAPTYDDPTMFYLDPVYPYNPVKSPGLLRRIATFPRQMTGAQQILLNPTYNDPTIPYNDPAYPYAPGDSPGILVRSSMWFNRPLVGSVESGLGEISWERLSDVAAIYTWDLSHPRNEVQYASDVNERDPDIIYSYEARDAHQDPDEEVVYRLLPVRSYTRT